MLANRISLAVIVAAVLGNAIHIGLGAMATVGGWQGFAHEFRQHFANTACFPCSIFFVIFMNVFWYGGPFYLSIALCGVRSVAILSSALMMNVGLIVLDIAWYYSGNSRDWHVVLAPIVLGGIAFVGVIILLVVHRTFPQHSRAQIAENPRQGNKAT